jgi:hypothetical protein
MNRNKKINRHVMYYHLCNMVSLCSGRRGELHAQRESEALGLPDDHGLSGHNFGHMHVPGEDFNVGLDTPAAKVTEGMYSAAGHKPHKDLDVGALTRPAAKNARPAGSHAGPRMAAATALILQEEEHDFANCPTAWACCLMASAGLIYKHIEDNKYFLSLGCRSLVSH